MGWSLTTTSAPLDAEDRPASLPVPFHHPHASPPVTPTPPLTGGDSGTLRGEPRPIGRRPRVLLRPSRSPHLPNRPSPPPQPARRRLAERHGAVIPSCVPRRASNWQPGAKRQDRQASPGSLPLGPAPSSSSCGGGVGVKGGAQRNRRSRRDKGAPLTPTPQPRKSTERGGPTLTNTDPAHPDRPARTRRQQPTANSGQPAVIEPSLSSRSSSVRPALCGNSVQACSSAPPSAPRPQRPALSAWGRRWRRCVRRRRRPRCGCRARWRASGALHRRSGTACHRAPGGKPGPPPPPRRRRRR
jgi:hypothetical protein